MHLQEQCFPPFIREKSPTNQFSSISLNCAISHQRKNLRAEAVVHRQESEVRGAEFPLPWINGSRREVEWNGFT